MGFHEAVENGFKGMIKSSSRVKYFRHQCKTLIGISRHFWKFVAIMEAGQYESFQKFIAAADHAIQAVASTGAPEGKKAKDEDLQRRLDVAIVELVDYWKDLSALDDDNYDPQTLMLEAREMDDKRKSKFASVEELKLKKVSIFKREVVFYLHEGRKPPLLLPLKISPESTGEELLFKLGRNPTSRIRLHENPFFYTRMVWDGDDTSAMRLGLMSKMSTEFCTRQGLSDFDDYFKSKEPQGPVHVFVDRNPNIHVLLTTREWSRLFSLVRVIDRGKVVVLKGVDGTLYHAQHIVERFIIPNAKISEYHVFSLDARTNNRVRHNANLQKFDCIHALCEGRAFICAEEGRRTSEQLKWLIEIPSEALNKNLAFDGWGPKPNIHKRPAFSFGSSPSVGAATSSAQTTSQVSRTKVDLDSATNRVKAMVERMENDRKEAEKKEKKGFLGRIFSRKA